MKLSNMWEHYRYWTKDFGDSYEVYSFRKEGVEYGCYEVEEILNQMEDDIRYLRSLTSGEFPDETRDKEIDERYL